MRKRNLLSSLILCGVLACSTTSCSNSVTIEEANKKINNAAQKTEIKFKEELNKDMFYFEVNYNGKVKIDLSNVYEKTITNAITEEVVSKNNETENYSLNNTQLLEVFGNFDKKYYLELDEKLPTDNGTDIFVHVKQTNKVTEDDEVEEDINDIAYRYVQSELGMVTSENSTDVANIQLPEQLDSIIGSYLATIIEDLNEPKDENKEEESFEEKILMIANSTNNEEIIEIAEYLVEEYDLENLTSEDIVDIIIYFLNNVISNSLMVITPSLKSYLVDSLNDIKELDTSKIIETTVDKKSSYTYYNYDLNYKELKTYINKVIKVLNDNLESLSGNEKVLLTSFVTLVEETIKAMLPKSLNISFGIGINDGTIMALALNCSVKGFEIVTNTSKSYDAQTGNYIEETYTTKINEMTFSLDFNYDFANKAYSIPKLNEYFKK